MENTHVKPISKDEALGSLGVATKKARRRLSSTIEVVSVAANRRLVKEGHFLHSVVVMLDGSATARDGQGAAAALVGPWAIDFWASDDARVAGIDVVSDSDATVLLIDWTHRDAVFTAIPQLRRLSRQTEAACSAAFEPADAQVPVEATPTSSPVLV